MVLAFHTERHMREATGILRRRRRKQIRREGKQSVKKKYLYVSASTMILAIFDNIFKGINKCINELLEFQFTRIATWT